MDLPQRRVYFAEVTIENGIINDVQKLEGSSLDYILPGFVDAHVHIESSMLVPTEFARMAVTHGTVATVSDPHEIANVLGKDGVYFMLENAAQSPFKFHFGAPSCVPATTFETAGAVIDSEGVRELLNDDRIYYLAEMMNYPGVIFDDPEVLRKLSFAKVKGKPIDGHAPGVTGPDAEKYFGAGITTDHECFSYEEGLEKARLGVKILIREGSAARNFDVLIPLLDEFPDQIMFCSDDKHPDDLAVGHINSLVARAIAKGCEVFDVLRAACLNPVLHYNLPVGLLRPGDPADFIITRDLANFSIDQTWIGGKLVAEKGKTLIAKADCEPVNHFNTSQKKPSDFICTIPNWHLQGSDLKMKVIQALEGQIVTGYKIAPAKVVDKTVVSDLEKDVLKFCVVNRYSNTQPSIAFISNFNLKTGALASCVGHDSHNILVVGVDDDSICQAVNLIIENKGGISAVDGNGHHKVLPLPVAGIMSDADGYSVGASYSEIDKFVKDKLGCSMKAPFMTLSFMALLVIPELKLSDLGLFDGKAFKFADLFVRD